MNIPPRNLREFLTRLRAENELKLIDEWVDPCLEIAEIHRRVIEASGPALFFRRVKGSPWPVVTNLFGSEKRVQIAFGDQVGGFISKLESFLGILRASPPKLGTLLKGLPLAIQAIRARPITVRRPPVLTHRLSRGRGLDLTELPALRTWPGDGGPFLTLPQVCTCDPSDHSMNLGMYRMQIFSKTRAGLHFQIGKGGGFHLAAAEARKQPLPVSVSLGGPPALVLAAILPLPEGIPEPVIASLILGQPLKLGRHPSCPIPFFAEAEFTLVGEAPYGVRVDEGPFGDHYGAYSGCSPFPVFECQHLFHRRDPIFPATVVGPPRQEDFFLGSYLAELLLPLLRLAIPQLIDFHAYGDAAFHTLAAAVVKERFEREAMTAAFRILGEGQLALTKTLLIFPEKSPPIRDFSSALPFLLERFEPNRDFYVFPNLATDTLDGCGPRLNHGSRAILLATGKPIRKLETRMPPSVALAEDRIREAALFCPGCLVLEGESHATDPKLGAKIAQNPSIGAFPLVILTDNVKKTVLSSTQFLWRVFTRFDPARDLFCRTEIIPGTGTGRSLPLVLDARTKAGYPELLKPDPTIQRRVEARWGTLF